MGISLRQFEQMKGRLNGNASAQVVPVASTRSADRLNEIILGIDPSLRGTGYGIIRLTRSIPETLAYGTISCSARWERSRCLAHISEVLDDAILKYSPAICVVEGLFYAQNLKTALIMGEARGAAMASVARAGIGIFEIAPRKVKQAVVGYGAAQKSAVARMVQRMLNLPQLPAPDAADALALALAHAHTNAHGLTPSKRI